jgi:succinyldiaminopimelate transaminase
VPTLEQRLPDFPWDTLAPAKAAAASHPDGIVDLSIGTPVDPTPLVAQRALQAAADSPGYPLTAGTPAVVEAIRSWAGRTLRAADPQALGVVPAIGTKEMVAWLPTLLGLGPSDTVVIPQTAYPTYEVGALVAGCRVLRADSTVALGPQSVSLIWVNSPGNPTGRVLGAEHLAKVVAFARSRGALVVSDECYFELPWSAENRPVSVLDPDVCGGSYRGVVALHSLSKRSNLAGYRFGFALGDAEVLSSVLAARKHTGFMVPGPVQAAAVAVLADDTHVAAQRDRYRRRRELLLAALPAAGFRIDHSEAGLYLWASRDEDCWASVEWLAGLGILVAPGGFYGPAGQRHVRIALTASDERVEAAARRLVEARGAA